MMKEEFRNAVFNDTLRNKVYGLSVIFVLPKKKKSSNHKKLGSLYEIWNI